MRDATLHGILEAFTTDAAGSLAAETADGAEIPFELTEQRRGRVPLYCYRPLTGAFIRDRDSLLQGLVSYPAAVQALTGRKGLEDYLRGRGGQRLPGDPRERAQLALSAFLDAVFADRSEFGFETSRFEAAYAELEQTRFEGRCTTSVIAPLLGLRLEPETRRIALGDGLSLVRGEELPDAPAEAVWSDGDEGHVLIGLTVAEDRGARSALSTARVRFRRILTALRLFERGGYALGPLAWMRTDAGAWRAVALGGSGRPRFVTTIAAVHEDELRAFCSLVARRVDGGELAWALARFEMGCERLAPFEALTDYLLALRALLEPEGPQTGRLAGRLAALCGRPADRAALAERVAHAISLERAVITGLAPAEPGVDALVEELAGHLRALLRDVICGHLDSDVKGVADDLIAEAAGLAPEGPEDDRAFDDDPAGDGADTGTFQTLG